MASRPTITDLAKAAGVSVATVDRVLNGRHKVREETARRVYDAANAIGYHAIGLIRQRVFEDLPQREIAERMGTSVSMIEKHIARGRLACRQCEDQLSADGDSGDSHVFRERGR